MRALFVRAFACSAELAETIGGHAIDRRFAARAAIIRQGDDGGETYLLIAGRARALLYGAGGQLVLLHDYGGGDLFGALASVDARPHDADVVAIDDVRAAMFAGADFVMLAQRHGCIGLALSRLLLERLRQTTSRMYERTTLSAQGRIYAELLREAKDSGGDAIRPGPVLAQLAGRVASTRETVSRTINALERRGIIARDEQGLTILAPRRLAEMIM